MPVAEARRGRPKGSGLDDNAHLKEITRRLASDPTLKPTTAIKSIGISDPSTIRRLRDKLRAVHGEGPGMGGSGPDGRTRTAAAETRTGTITAEPAFERTPAGTSCRSIGAGDVRSGAAGVSPVISTDPAMTWFAGWCGLGLHAISATVEAQLAAMETIFRAPPIVSVLRQQVLLNEHVMAFYASTPSVRNTLH